MGKGNLFENIKMAVVRNDVGCICCKGAINKLVIVMVSSNKAQMELWVDKLHELAFNNSVDYILGNDRAGFAGNDFQVFL